MDLSAMSSVLLGDRMESANVLGLLDVHPQILKWYKLQSDIFWFTATNNVPELAYCDCGGEHFLFIVIFLLCKSKSAWSWMLSKTI